MTAADVRAHILAFVSATQGPPDGVHRGELTADFDLRRDGAVDSLQFIQLLADLEARIGCAIELGDVAPEQVTNLDVLSQHIAAQISQGHSVRV